MRAFLLFSKMEPSSSRTSD